jgi:hypothetical protein
MRVDVHQHLWTEPLVEELSARWEFPFIRRESGLAVLYLADERPYVIDLSSEQPSRRAELVGHDGLDRALLCLSSPLGIEGLSREQAVPLLDAYHEGALALGEPFGVWGAIPLADPDPGDVDVLLARGCVGLSLPAGAISSLAGLSRLAGVLERLACAGAPLLVHSGPGRVTGVGACQRELCLSEPLWWPAMTRYVSGMQEAWLAFVGAGRAAHPHLRVIFTMLAGLAPLHGDRLRARGGPELSEHDPLLFYDSSSYGAQTARMVTALAPSQLLYGSDRPVVEPAELGMPAGMDWDSVAGATARALSGAAVADAVAR